MPKAFAFREERSFDERCREATRVRGLYPDRIPVICEKDPACLTLPAIDKTKYLVPTDLTAAQFLYVIRRRLQLQSEQALFLFGPQRIPPPTEPLSISYHQHRDADGFLYLTYSGEHAFGELFD